MLCRHLGLLLLQQLNRYPWHQDLRCQASLQCLCHNVNLTLQACSPLLLEDQPFQLDPVQCQHAAFQSAKAPSALGQGSSATYARRAYRVVVQTGQGSSKVRAISPSAIRAVETPPPGWHQAYGLGDVVISGWRHRVLPDGFISDAVQYPEL